MKLSQFPKEELHTLTDAQISAIVYGDWEDDDGKADVALLLGGHPAVCAERANAAAQLYHSGRVSYIMPTGGVEWESAYGKYSECALLHRFLLEEGVPEEAVLLENEATTTVENMLYCTLQMTRKLNIYQIKRVYVVTSACHLRRSLVHARNYLPRWMEVAGFCIPREESDKEHWFLDPFHAPRTRRELPFIKNLVTIGYMDDIEF